MAERKSKVAETSKTAESEETPAKATSPAAPAAPAAAPLDAPQPKTVAEPRDSIVQPSNAVTPTRPLGTRATRLVDEDGNELTPADFLEYPAADASRHEAEHPQIFVQDPRRLVTVTRKVFREYTPDNARTKMTQLLYNTGARIPKGEADRLQADSMPPPRGAGDWTGGPVGQNDPS